MELSAFQIREEIATLQVFHYDVDVVLILKEIKHANDIRMLTDFQDFDLTFQQLLIFQVQFLLLDDLDCDLFASFLVIALLHDTVLALSKSLTNIKEVIQVGVTNDLLDGSHPFLFLGLNNAYQDRITLDFK